MIDSKRENNSIGFAVRLFAVTVLCVVITVAIYVAYEYFGWEHGLSTTLVTGAVLFLSSFLALRVVKRWKSTVLLVFGRALLLAGIFYLFSRSIGWIIGFLRGGSF